MLFANLCSTRRTYKIHVVLKGFCRFMVLCRLTLNIDCILNDKTYFRSIILRKKLKSTYWSFVLFRSVTLSTSNLVIVSSHRWALETSFIEHKTTSTTLALASSSVHGQLISSQKIVIFFVLSNLKRSNYDDSYIICFRLAFAVVAIDCCFCGCGVLNVDDDDDDDECKRSPSKSQKWRRPLASAVR